MTETTEPACRDCPGCRALAAEYAGDPDLLEYYRRKLLIRGWAGKPSPAERAYQLAHAPWAARASSLGAGTIHANRPQRPRSLSSDGPIEPSGPDGHPAENEGPDHSEIGAPVRREAAG